MLQYAIRLVMTVLKDYAAPLYSDGSSPWLPWVTRAAILLEDLDILTGAYSTGIFSVSVLKLLSIVDSPQASSSEQHRNRKTPRSSRMSTDKGFLFSLWRPFRRYGTYLCMILSLVFLLLWTIDGLSDLQKYVMYKRGFYFTFLLVTVTITIPSIAFFGLSAIKKLNDVTKLKIVSIQSRVVRPDGQSFATSNIESALGKSTNAHSILGVEDAEVQIARAQDELQLRLYWMKWMTLLVISNYILWCILFINAMWVNELYSSLPFQKTMLGFKIFDDAIKLIIPTIFVAFLIWSRQL
ncbi:hypothetical protein HDU91_001865 [Kappamyces sp. JEL0680]|nr:hypothetical protein HDU91_001865 [Kappamyces sp. JEL0680]